MITLNRQSNIIILLSLLFPNPFITPPIRQKQLILAGIVLVKRAASILDLEAGDDVVHFFVWFDRQDDQLRNRSSSTTNSSLLPLYFLSL